MKKLAQISNDEMKTCWWCGALELSGEHKFKATDLKTLYGERESFKLAGVSIIDYKDKKSQKLQSPKSDFAKFENSLCLNCNNTKSQKSDFAYEKMIAYYLDNEEDIKSKKVIDFSVIYGLNWEEEKENLYRYILKHVGCRMFENKLRLFEDSIKYLDSCSINRHLKVVIQIKPYNFLGINNLYKGPLIPIVSDKVLNDIFAVCGWFTIKNLTFNYVYEWNIKNYIEPNPLEIYLTDYSKFDSSLVINQNTLANDYGNIIEKLEYHPYNPQQKLNIYRDLKNKSIC